MEDLNRRSFLGRALALLAVPFAFGADTPTDPIGDPIPDPIGDPTGLTVDKLVAARDALLEQALPDDVDFHVLMTEDQYDQLRAADKVINPPLVVDESGAYAMQAGKAMRDQFERDLIDAFFS